MQNAGHGGPHMTPFMKMFVFYVSPPIPNIEKFQLYEVSHQISHQISLRMPPESCLGTHF